MTKRTKLLGGTLAFVVLAALVGSFAIDRHYKRRRCADEAGVVHEPCLVRNAIQARYGANLHSQWGEELLVRDFFDDQRGGFFVDIGAGDWSNMNMTLTLEQKLGWRGVAVDANAAFAPGYAQNRPNTRFFVFFVGDKTEASHPFFVSERWALSSGDKKYADHYGPSKEVKVPSITLDDLLAREKVTKIDFLSMDIEEGEPAALAGFDIGKYAPELVCIEIHEHVGDKIAAYMSAHGYVVVERYVPLDNINRYYAPRSSKRLRR